MADHSEVRYWQEREPESTRTGDPVSGKEKVLVALTIFCFTEAIRLFLHNLLPVAVRYLLGF
jgi:hypothetical protein